MHIVFLATSEMPNMSLISLLTQGHIRGNVSHNSINLGNHTRWNQYFYRFTLTEMTINTSRTLQWENDCREQLSDVEYLRRYIPSLFLILPAYPWIKVKEIVSYRCVLIPISLSPLTTNFTILRTHTVYIC